VIPAELVAVIVGRVDRQPADRLFGPDVEVIILEVVLQPRQLPRGLALVRIVSSFFDTPRLGLALRQVSSDCQSSSGSAA
jgi:hypothetical protein